MAEVRRALAAVEGEAAAVWVPIESLVPWQRNPRKNEAAVPAVVESIARFGFGNPILAREANREVIAGHTRLKAAQALGMRTVPVRFLPLGPDEAHLLAMADNKLGEIAEWDETELAGLLAEFTRDDAKLAGFDEEELERLLRSTETTPPPPDEAPAVHVDAVSVAGEVYELGPHRLACGDSTDPEVWAKLLGDERVQLVWTDPPYGVSYVGKTKDALTIQNDGLVGAALRGFLSEALGAVAARCVPGAAWYVSSPAGDGFGDFGAVLGREGLGIWRHTLIWVKDRFVLGRCDYHYRHEPVFYGWVPGGTHHFIDDRKQDSVWEIDRPARNEEHPTMKPIELVARALRNSSREGWIVADAFGGSGTTLMAAQQERRVARLVEKDPRYCDVIRRRWTIYARSNNIDPGPGALAPAQV